MKIQPNLFILGAPKCGTSSLSKWLSFHDDVFLPVVKEPHYYNSDEKHRFFESREGYLELFKGSESFKYRVDASTWYLHSTVAVNNIVKDCPEAKFIVCLRNPTDVAFSLHNHFVNRSGREHITSFKKAWDMSDDRIQGKNINKLVTEPAYLAYKYSCMLGTQCENLLKLVPRSKVQFVILDELLDQPNQVLSELLDFLELSDDITLEIPHDNKSIKRRSLIINRSIRRLGQLKNRLGITISTKWVGKILDRLNSRNTRYEIDPDVRSFVNHYFRHEIKTIFKITGSYHPRWLE